MKIEANLEKEGLAGLINESKDITKLRGYDDKFVIVNDTSNTLFIGAGDAAIIIITKLIMRYQYEKYHDWRRRRRANW